MDLDKSNAINDNNNNKLSHIFDSVKAYIGNDVTDIIKTHHDKPLNLIKGNKYVIVLFSDDIIISIIFNAIYDRYAQTEGGAYGDLGAGYSFTNKNNNNPYCDKTNSAFIPYDIEFKAYEMINEYDDELLLNIIKKKYTFENYSYDDIYNPSDIDVDNPDDKIHYVDSLCKDDIYLHVENNTMGFIIGSEIDYFIVKRNRNWIMTPYNEIDFDMGPVFFVKCTLKI